MQIERRLLVLLVLYRSTLITAEVCGPRPETEVRSRPNVADEPEVRPEPAVLEAILPPWGKCCNVEADDLYVCWDISSINLDKVFNSAMAFIPI